MSEKLKTCPVCGKEMAANAKACPSCGAKNKKPIFKKWWFWVLVIVVIAGIGSAIGGGNKAPASDDKPQSQEDPQTPPVTYQSFTVRQLMDDLDNNALKAEDTYQDQSVALTGRLSNIDSDGKYITLLPSDDPYAFTGVQCYIKTDAQRSAVMEMAVDSEVTVRGKITSIGEVLGYSLDIDDFGA